MSDDPIVGHMTFVDGHHEPLRQSEADAILAAVDAAKAKRVVEMPDSATALRAASEARQRLSDLGWRDGIYCPKDGSAFAILMWGSTGIHNGHYTGKWPDGHVYCGDFLYHPQGIMWKAIDKLTDDERSAMEHSIEDARLFMERQVRMFVQMDPEEPRQ